MCECIRTYKRTADQTRAARRRRSNKAKPAKASELGSGTLVGAVTRGSATNARVGVELTHSALPQGEALARIRVRTSAPCPLVPGAASCAVETHSVQATPVLLNAPAYRKNKRLGSVAQRSATHLAARALEAVVIVEW